MVWREHTAIMRRRLVFGIVWDNTAANPTLLASVRSEKGRDQSGNSRATASARPVVRNSNSACSSGPHTNSTLKPVSLSFRSSFVSTPVWRAKG